MKKIAIYPGTFDPITNGHIDLVDRATKLFDYIIVAVAQNKNKKPLIPFEDRIKLVEQDVKHIKNVEVIGFTGLLVDTARKHKANIQIRGLRVITDFEYEFQMANMNRLLDSTLESVFIFPSSKNAFLSSSLVKEISSHEGDITQFVSQKTAIYLKEHLNTN